MTFIRRFTSGQSRRRGRDAGEQPPAQAAPPVEAYNDRNEELLGRLLCVTARDDAFAPTGILGGARDIRPDRSVGGVMPMYSRSSSAERGASLYGPSVSHGQHQKRSRKFLVVIFSLTVPESALGNRTIVVTRKVTTLTELSNVNSRQGTINRTSKRNLCVKCWSNSSFQRAHSYLSLKSSHKSYEFYAL